MVTLDRIRLTGLLKENPAICRVFLFLFVCSLRDRASPVHHATQVRAQVKASVVSLNRLVEPKRRHSPVSAKRGTARTEIDPAHEPEDADEAFVCLSPRFTRICMRFRPALSPERCSVAGVIRTG
jgi:hypothetical protein